MGVVADVLVVELLVYWYYTGTTSTTDDKIGMQLFSLQSPEIESCILQHFRFTHTHKQTCILIKTHPLYINCLKPLID